MNNMGAMKEIEIETFAELVINELQLKKWQMKWTTSGSWCNRKGKILYIDRQWIGSYPWGAKECVLHEASHIFTPDKQHGVSFYKEYVKLLDFFMIRLGEAKDA